ncbi:MAG: hypothetical protein ABEJ88_03015 [Halobacterium sp.]
MADEDGSWRFDLDEVGPDAEPRHEPIEPGSPSAENVAFFVLGVSFMLAVFWLLLFG